MYNNLGDLIRFDKERTVYIGGGGLTTWMPKDERNV